VDAVVANPTSVPKLDVSACIPTGLAGLGSGSGSGLPGLGSGLGSGLPGLGSGLPGLGNLLAPIATLLGSL
ncbi:MAG: hypothetical protein ACRDY0_11960, partial [Acidimicrobiales bacterium]